MHAGAVAPNSIQEILPDTQTNIRHTPSGVMRKQARNARIAAQLLWEASVFFSGRPHLGGNTDDPRRTRRLRLATSAQEPTRSAPKFDLKKFLPPGDSGTSGSSRRQTAEGRLAYRSASSAIWLYKIFKSTNTDIRNTNIFRSS